MLQVKKSQKIDLQNSKKKNRFQGAAGEGMTLDEVNCRGFLELSIAYHHVPISAYQSLVWCHSKFGYEVTTDMSTRSRLDVGRT